MHYLKELPTFKFQKRERTYLNATYFKSPAKKEKNLLLSHIAEYALKHRVKVKCMSADTAIYEKMTDDIDLDFRSIRVIFIAKSYPEVMIGVIDSYANIIRDKTGHPVWILAYPNKVIKPLTWTEIKL